MENDNKKTKVTKPVKDRAYHKRIFYQFWEQYNYIPVPDMRGNGVEYLIDELHEKYPPFWFMTSHGRVFSVAGDKFRQLTPQLNPGSNGKRRWEYEYSENGKTKHFFVHQMVAEHCCENPYEENVKVELHHITPTKKFGENDCFLTNQVCNLQWIPKTSHNKITYKFAIKEWEDAFENSVVLNEKDEERIVNCLLSMQQQGIPIAAKIFSIEDVNEEWFRNHDVSHREMKNVTVEVIEE